MENNNSHPDKITDEEHKTLSDLYQQWLDAHNMMRFRFTELDIFKRRLLINKYGLDPNGYKIINDTGEIRKR